jgi:hemerythrin-like domain-containing protein
MTITTALHAEHVHLMAGLEELRHTGDRIGMDSHEADQEAAERAILFLRDRLIPHARSEEETLYPVVARVLGSLRSTRTMVRDHAEVKTLTNQLVRATEENDEPMMRRLLYGLYHVIRLHFAKEEEVYLPLLEEDLDRAESEELLHAMGTA